MGKNKEVNEVKAVSIESVEQILDDKYKLNELFKEIVDLVAKYNTLKSTDGVDEKLLKDCDKDTEDKVAAYAKLAQSKCFDECKAQADPMLEAVKRLTFKVVKVKDVNTGTKEVEVRNRQYDEVDRPIDLMKLYAHCGKIGVDEKWIYQAQKFNCLFTMKRCEDLGISTKEVNNSFAMDSLAREVELGKNPCSNTNFKKTLQALVNAMIGEYKVTDHDVRFISMAYQKKGKKALTITTSNNRQLIGLLAEVCHKLVCNKTYSVDYKKSSK